MDPHKWTVETSQGDVAFRLPLPVYQARVVLAAKRAGIVEMMVADDDEARAEAAVDPSLVMGAMVGYSWIGMTGEIKPRGMDILDYGEAVLYWLRDEGYVQADVQAMATAAFKRIVYDAPKATEVEERADFSEAQPENNSSLN